MPPAYKTKTVTIAINESVSGELDLEGYRFVSIQMPAAWTAANLTFQAAEKAAGTFNNLYDDEGTEAIAIAAASRQISMSLYSLAFAPLQFIKIRSGTAATPVNQAAARTIRVFLKSWG